MCTQYCFFIYQFICVAVNFVDKAVKYARNVMSNGSQKYAVVTMVTHTPQ